MPLLAAAAPVAAPARRPAPAPRASAARPAAPAPAPQPGARQPAARLAALPGSGDGVSNGGAHDAAQRPAPGAASASWGDAPAASTEAPLLADGDAEASQERDAPPAASSAPPSGDAAAGNALQRALREVTAQEYVVSAVYGMLAALTVARCVATPVALPMRLMGAILAALLCRFAGDAAMWARGVPQSLSDSDATALRPWLALRLAAELGGGALAAATRNGCAGATLLVAGHLAFNAATSGRMDEYGYVRKLDGGVRQRLTGVSAVVTALGVAACATSANAPPGSPRATAALATSIAFTVAVGCWLLFVAGKTLLLWMLARTFAGQRC